MVRGKEEASVHRRERQRRKKSMKRKAVMVKA